MARPSKYSPETVKKITDALMAGNTRGTSALYAGVCQDTLNNWLNRYSDFRQAVEKAEASAEVGHVLNIKLAATKGNWTASAWWLERRRHEDWGRKDRLEIINSVRELARASGADEDAAVAEAESFLKELRGVRARS
jgi:hypothetical protein